MKVKTKSGFECEVNEHKFEDWRYVEAAVKINGTNPKEILEGIVFVVPFLSTVMVFSKFLITLLKE